MSAVFWREYSHAARVVNVRHQTRHSCVSLLRSKWSALTRKQGNHTNVTTADLQTFLLVCESSSTADIVSVAANMTPWQPSWLTMHRRARTRIRSNLLESHSHAVRASFETPGFPLGHCLHNDCGHATCSGGAALSSLRQPPSTWQLFANHRKRFLTSSWDDPPRQLETSGSSAFHAKTRTSGTFPREYRRRGWVILHKNENTETRVSCAVLGMDCFTCISNSRLRRITVLCFMCWESTVIP